MPSKAEERMYVDAFLQATRGVVVDEEGESPDFVLRDSLGRLGLEVANVFPDEGENGSRAKSDEVKRVRLLAAAAKHYYAQSNRPLAVTALFAEGGLPTPVSIAEGLLSVASAEELTPLHLCLFDRTRLTVTPLPAGYGEYSRWKCVNNSSGRVGALRPSDLEDRIADKATKLDAYRKRVDRVALLLVANRTQSSGLVEWVDDGESIALQGFEAIFLFIYPTHVVVLADSSGSNRGWVEEPKEFPA